jgi:hypothetical protein
VRIPFPVAHIAGQDAADQPFAKASQLLNPCLDPRLSARQKFDNVRADFHVQFQALCESRIAVLFQAPDDEGRTHAALPHNQSLPTPPATKIKKRAENLRRVFI